MKKFLFFLSIFMVADSGFTMECGEKISVVSDVSRLDQLINKLSYHNLAHPSAQDCANGRHTFNHFKKKDPAESLCNILFQVDSQINMTSPSHLLKNPILDRLCYS